MNKPDILYTLSFEVSALKLTASTFEIQTRELKGTIMTT